MSKEHTVLNGVLRGEGRKGEKHHPYPVLWIWDFLLLSFRPCSPLFTSMVSWLKGRSFMVVRPISSTPTLFPQLSECWLRVTLYHDHLLTGGGSSLYCPMMYYIQCQGGLMFLVCMYMPVCGRAWPSLLLPVCNVSETWKDWYGTLKALMLLHTHLCLMILM